MSPPPDCSTPILEPVGPETAGSEAAGPEPVGPEPVGPEAAGLDAERWARLALDLARMGTWSLDLATDALDADARGRELLGFGPAEALTGEAVFARTHPDDVAALRASVAASVTAHGAYDADFRLCPPRGGVRQVVVRGRVECDPSGAPVRLAGVAYDVTAAREAERALRAVATTVDGIITIDERGRIESFNPAAERIFGYAASEVIGDNVSVLMPEPYHSEHDEYLRAFHETGRRRIIGIGREVSGQRKDGSVFPMDLAVSETPTPARLLFTGVVRDISERRALEWELLRVQKEEQRRIGQDLHDGLGQMLTGAVLSARRLARRLRASAPSEGDALADGSPLSDDADDLVADLKAADRYSRDLARGLVPVEIEQGGLQAALEVLAAQAGRLLHISVTVEDAGAPPVGDPGVAVQLYRIAQEAISNAVRHGRARRVSVTLATDEGGLRLEVSDDGSGWPDDMPAADGIPPSGAGRASPAGAGLRIMHHRASVLGGVLKLRATPGGGACVVCALPRAALVGAPFSAPRSGPAP